MIRVLHVFHGMDCGGAETMVMNLYRHINRSKVQFDFLVHTTKKCFFDDEIKSLGGRIFSVPYYKIANEKQYKRALEELFKTHPEIRIVHGHLGSCAHVYLQVAKQYGCYAIAHSHNTKPKGFSLKNCLYRLFTYKTRKIADYFFGCSIAAAEYRFGKKIAQSKNCSFLNNAIDLHKFEYSLEARKDIRREFGLKDQFVVGHVGRFNLQKNHFFLIDFFKEIYRENPNAILMLLGDGEQRKKIESKVAQLGLCDNVIFAGVRSDVDRCLSAFDVFAFPSLYEGLPVTLIEAQANGLPVVCSDSITKEIVITDCIEMLSLNQSVGEWALAVSQKKNSRRKGNVKDDLVKAGYDIKKTSLWLENFYINVKYLTK